MKSKTTLLQTALCLMLILISGNIKAQKLEARYTFNENYTDVSGNGLDLYATGFDGTNSSYSSESAPEGSHFFNIDLTDVTSTYGEHILITQQGTAGEIVNAPASLTGNNSRTITAWINVADFTYPRSIAGLGGSTANTRFDFLVKNTAGSMVLRCEKAGAGFESTAALNPNQWYFVALTYDNTKGANMYLGDASTEITGSVGSAAWSGLETIVESPIFVANGAQSNRPFWGGLDDVRFYSGALTIEELNKVRTGATLGVNDIAFGRNEIKAFPTAVDNVLNLKTTVNSLLEVTVHSLLGKTVLRVNGDKVDMSALSGGIYIVKVRAGAKVANFKVVKK